jgi:hypothetical protein
MSRSKKIFIGISIIFLLILLLLSIDISRRTTFPGNRDSEKQSSDTVDSKH